MKNSNTPNHRVAFLWDESFLWGLMAYKALQCRGLPFDLVTSKDIQGGILDKYRMLFVPGGWASNKGKALGESGVKAIRQFVENGGNYLGFCGGAGLATQAKGGIGLLNVKRRPTKERVPSFSGRIYLNVCDHDIWNSKLQTPDSKLIFHAWWPSQFIVEDSVIKVLAAYGGALPDSFSADLNVGDVDANGNWAELEKIYRINLDPGRLLNEPSVIEGTYGKGKVVLSLVHFDTPDDPAGEQVLMNLWEYLADCKVRNSDYGNPAPVPVGTHESPLQNPCAELIALGERNFLWFWRNSMLLQWRRGVRGLEYNTLYIMMKEIDEIMRSRSAEHGAESGDEIKPAAERISGLLVPFIEKAKKLLLLERQALQKGHITYEKCDDPGIKKIRSELFADSKSYGGMFKELIDEIDGVLLHLLKRGG